MLLPREMSSCIGFSAATVDEVRCAASKTNMRPNLNIIFRYGDTYSSPAVAHGALSAVNEYCAANGLAFFTPPDTRLLQERNNTEH